MALFGAGSMLGEEDLVRERKTHSCTLKCQTSFGSLYVLPTYYLTQIRENPFSWEQIKSNVVHKEKMRTGKQFNSQPKPDHHLTPIKVKLPEVIDERTLKFRKNFLQTQSNTFSTASFMQTQADKDWTQHVQSMKKSSQNFHTLSSKKDFIQTPLSLVFDRHDKALIKDSTSILNLATEPDEKNWSPRQSTTKILINPEDLTMHSIAQLHPKYTEAYKT